MGTLHWRRRVLGLLVVAPVLVAYAFLQRYIVSGLTAGSIKG